MALRTAMGLLKGEKASSALGKAAETGATGMATGMVGGEVGQALGLERGGAQLAQTGKILGKKFGIT